MARHTGPVCKHCRREGDKLEWRRPVVDDAPMAFIGVRACDLTAIKVLDRVWMGAPFQETRYVARRRQSFVVAINCLEPDAIQTLTPWCGVGRTVALMGSSGVGKSTLVNTLLGDTVQRTGTIREADSKGRHVTTGRSLHPIMDGGLLLDTPGMRELQLTDCEDGVNATFADITTLAEQCRFGDCRHDGEPGCAVQAAITRGELDARRLSSYQKLLREQAFNSATLAEKRARDRSFGKMIKSVMEEKKAREG